VTQQPRRPLFETRPRPFSEPEEDGYLYVVNMLTCVPATEALPPAEAEVRRDQLNATHQWPDEWVLIELTGARVCRLNDHQWLVSSASQPGYVHMVTELQGSYRSQATATVIFPSCTCPEGRGGGESCWHRRQAWFSEELAAGRPISE